MMGVVVLVVLAFWTLLVIRVFSARATLSDRTFFSAFVAGAFLGPLMAPVAYRLVPGFNTLNALFQSALVVAALASVAFLPLLRRRAYRVTSVADAFLLAFLVGFGFDVSVSLLSTGAGNFPLKGWSFFPPWTFHGESYGGSSSSPGNGYWIGLVALALSAGFRFVRERKKAWLLALAALLYAAAECASLITPSSGKVIGLFTLLTLHGRLTPFLALALLTWLSVLEGNWVKKNVPSAKFSPLEEGQAYGAALRSLNFGEYSRLRRLFGLRAEAQLAEAELKADPGNKTLLRLKEALALKIREAEGAPKPEAKGAGNAFVFSLKREPLQAALWGFLLLAFVVVPRLPEKASSFFWSAFLFHFPAIQLPALHLLLSLLLIWRFVSALPRLEEEADPDDLVRFRVERSLLQGGMAVVLLTLIYVNVEDLSPFNHVMARILGGGPQVDQARLTTFFLLLGAAATGWGAARSREWKPAAGTRRAAQVRQALTAATYVVVALVGLSLFQKGAAHLHAKYGPQIYNRFQNHGNDAADMMAALPTAALCFGLGKILTLLSRRLERFLGSA